MFCHLCFSLMHICNSLHFPYCFTSQLCKHERLGNNSKNMPATIMNSLRNQTHEANTASTIHQINVS
nr:hypothetical protein Iba_chr12eCG1470 [Ipomoea batatas]